MMYVLSLLQYSTCSIGHKFFEREFLRWVLFKEREPCKHDNRYKSTREYFVFQQPM